MERPHLVPVILVPQILVQSAIQELTGIRLSTAARGRGWGEGEAIGEPVFA
jgi:hypothetical protein